MSEENMKQKSPTLRFGVCNVLFSSGDEAVLSPGMTNVSSTVLGVLESGQKMTARDIAGLGGLSCEDTIDILLYLECISVVYQLNGYWMLTPVSEPSFRKAPERTRRTRVRRNEKEPG